MNTHTLSSRRIPSRLHTRASIAPTIHLLAAAIALIAAVVAMSGCAPDRDDHSQYPGNDGIAVTPFSMESCAGGATYRGNAWDRSPWASYNAMPYQQQGCAPGSQPMCDGQYGLVCVPAQAFGQYDVAWWTPSPVFSGYSGYGHVSQYSHMWGAGAAMGRTCQVGTHSCGHGAHCQPLRGGGIGVCVR